MRGTRRRFVACSGIAAARLSCGGAIWGSSAQAQQRVEAGAAGQLLPQAHVRTPGAGTHQQDLLGGSADVAASPSVDAAALGPIPGAPSAARESNADNFWSAPRRIWLSRAASHGQPARTIQCVWWRDGSIIAEAYEDLSLFLGDPSMYARMAALRGQDKPIPRGWHHAVWMSPVVLDILYALTAWLEVFGMARPIEITSAFRHPTTNAATEGAARNSLHQSGGAVDVVIPGVAASNVARFGTWMRGGGVGVYPARGFTHLDGGRVRQWRGR